MDVSCGFLFGSIADLASLRPDVYILNPISRAVWLANNEGAIP